MSGFQFSLNLVLQLGIAEKAITSFSNPGNMDVNKEDIDKMSDEKIMGDEEIKKSIKIRIQKLIIKLDEYIITHKSIPERIEALKFKEAWDVFNKELTWFFAISVGTLLWILSNFDKFKIPDGSMPHKYLYMLSIILVGFSSLLLAKLQGESFLYQHKNIKHCNRLVISINGYLRDLNNLKDNLDNALKQLDSDFPDKSLDSLSKSDDFITSFDITKKHLNILFDSFEKSIIESNRLVFTENIIIPAVIIYISGIICVSAYILLFMIDYVK